MRPRYIIAALVLSVFVAAVAVPSLQVLWGQVSLAIPGGDTAEASAAGRSYSRRVRQEPRLAAVEIALQDSLYGRAEATPPEVDQENGLYEYLSLLDSLPPARALPASRPAEDPSLAARVRALKDAPPVRLYALQHWGVAWDACASSGMPARLAAYYADVFERPYGSLYRSVVRRLAGGLLAQAKAWREAGRAADAVAADRAVVRLMSDLVDDSPTPSVVLLAAEYMPAGLRGLAKEAVPAGLPPATIERDLAQAARVEALRRRWDNSAGRGMNFLPWTGDAVLARRQHDRVLGSMVASGCTIGTWLMLGFVCLVLLPSAVGFWRSDQRAGWRWSGYGRLAAVGIVLAPMLAAVLVFLTEDLPLMWLLSLESLRGFVWPLLLAPVLVGLAAWVYVILPDEYQRVRIPRRAVIIMAGLAVLVLVAMMLRPVRPESWRPPAGVQIFRRIGPWIGLETLLLMAVWMIWGLLRRRRSGLRGGPRAAASLGVAAWAWLATAVIGFAVLQVNASHDIRHEKAFLAAAADPLADRLGPDWKTEYFGKIEELGQGG